MVWCAHCLRREALLQLFEDFNDQQEFETRHESRQRKTPTEAQTGETAHPADWGGRPADRASSEQLVRSRPRREAGCLASQLSIERKGPGSVPAKTLASLERN